MRLRIQWLIFSLSGGALAAAALLFFPNTLSPSLPPLLDQIIEILFWPVYLCEHLVGPGPTIGGPSSHLHEGTPVHLLAAAFGLGITWMFWSSLVLLVIRSRKGRRSRRLGVAH